MTVPGPQLVGVFGAKGGCGATLVAAHVAAGSGHDGACVVDFDFGKGDLAGLLDVVPVLPVPELLVSALDPALLRGSAARHRSGVMVLGQPKDMSLLVRPTTQEALALLRSLRDAWPFVVVDLGSRVDEVVLGALREIDQLLLVTSTTLPALRDAVRVRALTERADALRSPMWIVGNTLQKDGGIARHEAEALLHARFDAVLPYDPHTCDTAFLDGALVWENHPGAPLAQALAGLWTRLVDGVPAAPRWHMPWVGGEG